MSEADHRVQSGVDISLIAPWLGHESIETIETTHVYIDADMATKQRAFVKLAPVKTASFPVQTFRWRARLPAAALIILATGRSHRPANTSSRIRFPQSVSAGSASCSSFRSGDVAIDQHLEFVPVE
ncbi:hypothetical protein BZM27_24945 [Paraburkholderia steynii]|uniref:Uncharacterized protein n=1 Tax=Paraburkholderia steynii TaxID=1245441 RepID=A0A4R0XHC7_9BURK|nr:hypothetical protein BZM27_24945 [Paraburkholderia steynii]